LNEVAAHYSPKSYDKMIFNKGDLIKLDVGSHVDGYIADVAMTIEIRSNNHSNLIKSSNEALEKAIEIIKPGIEVTEIGNIIESTIKSYNFVPIDNLTGHSLDRFELHSGISIPNIANAVNKTKLKSGDVIAIEPFSTYGKGHVLSGNGSNIYLIQQSIKSRLIRDNKLKILFDNLNNKFGTLPFAHRWCEKMTKNIEISLKKLQFYGLIKHYPQLIEQNKGAVSQKEHTVIVTEDGSEVISSI